METVRKDNKGLKISIIIIIRIIWVVGYLAMTILSLSVGVRDYLSMKANPDAGHNGMAFVLVLFLIGTIVYGIISVLGLISLVLSIIYKNSAKRKRNITLSVLELVIPYLTEILLFVLFGKIF